MNLHTSSPKMDLAKSDSPAFSVLIVHEDDLTEYRARRMLQSVLQELDGLDPISLRLCRMDALIDSILREQMARLAEDSSLVVLSAYGRHQSPPELRDWLREWGAPETRGPRAFAVLLHGDPEAQKISKTWLNDLRQAAHARRSDFFYGLCNVDPTGPVPAMRQAVGSLVGQLPHWRTVIAPPPLINARANQRHWGINE